MVNECQSEGDKFQRKMFELEEAMCDDIASYKRQSAYQTVSIDIETIQQYWDFGSEVLNKQQKEIKGS